MSDRSSDIPISPDEIQTSSGGLAQENLEFPPIAEPVIPLAPCANFCHVCGIAWNPAWTACEPCAGRAIASVVAEIPRRRGGRSLFSAIAFYFVLLVTNLASFVVAAIVVDDAERAYSIGMLVAVLVDIVFIGGWLIAWWADVKHAVKSIGKAQWYFAAVGLACITFGIATGVMKSIVWLISLEDKSYLDSMVEFDLGWWPIVLVACVQAPLLEEIAFRGIIFSALHRLLDVRDVILVSSLMFMVLHLDVTMFPHTLSMGLAAGYLRHRSGSLYPCILLHFVHNSLAVASEQFGW